MAKTQTIVAFFVVLVFILATLFLNEAVYSERDLNVRLDVHSYSNISMAPADCRFTRATNVGETSLGKDNFSVEDDIARELLYGGFSARGATISGIILSVFAFILSVIGVGLDLDMTASKYPSGAWIHAGDTKTFVAGILIRLLVVGAILSMLLASLCSLAALVQQGYVPSGGLDMGQEDFNPRKLPDECSSLDDNVIHRSDNLKGSLFTSTVSIFAIGFMVYAIRYDIKASS